MVSDVPSAPLRFFVLETLLGGQHDTEFSAVNREGGPQLICPRCGKGVGTLTWQPPFQVELELHGKDFADLVEGVGGDLLITERFAEDFKAEGLTGLQGFHPVEVVRVRRGRRRAQAAPPPRYLFVTPVYGPTALDLNRSRVWTDKPLRCIDCGYASIDAIDGLFLDVATWDGADVFRPRNLWGIVLVSERFVRFAERHAMSHFTFVPMEKYVWDPLERYYLRPVQLPPPGKG